MNEMSLGLVVDVKECCLLDCYLGVVVAGVCVNFEMEGEDAWKTSDASPSESKCWKLDPPKIFETIMAGAASCNKIFKAGMGYLSSSEQRSHHRRQLLEERCRSSEVLSLSSDIEGL